GAAFMRRLAERLAGAGVALWRLRYALMTMHPEVLWRSVLFRAHQGVVVADQPRARLEDAFYTNSPVAIVRQSLTSLRVRRGRGERIDAAIWFSDVRRFTELSDRAPPSRVIEVLAGCFDVIAGAISDHAGEVLKFIGDAVLAIFPLADDPRGACRRALAA